MNLLKCNLSCKIGLSLLHLPPSKEFLIIRMISCHFHFKKVEAQRMGMILLSTHSNTAFRYLHHIASMDNSLANQNLLPF